MNHFEMKMKKIIEILLESDRFVTLESISQQVGVSKRSIQNYMYRIENLFTELGLCNSKFLKKQGYGIRLVVEKPDREKLGQHLNTREISLYEDGVFRRLEVLKTLIFSNDELTIQFFADQFYISRTVILKDLGWISQWLSGFNLKLFKTQRRGIGIDGNEAARRNAIAGFFDIYNTREMPPINECCTCERLTDEKYQSLRSVYPKMDILRVCSIIEDAEREFDFFLTDEYYTTLVTHLVISIARLGSGKNVEECFLPPEAEYGGIERKTAEYVASKIEAEFRLVFPESERIYICIHLMSYNAFNYSEMNNLNSTLKSIPKKIELLAINLIDYVDAQLGTSFSSDKLLFFGILFHLKTSIHRLEDNIVIKTANRDEFSNVNKEILNAISKAGGLYEEICGVRPTEEELITLTMHFALSQKRSIRRKKAIIVCNNGINAGLALYRQVVEAFQHIEVIDVCTSFQLTFKSENDYDILISTVTLEGVGKPAANLSHVAKSDYIRYLDEFLFSHL